MIHLAALMRFHAPRQVLYRFNVEGAKAIAADALATGVHHFIFASSTEAIGPVEKPPGDEKTPLRPTYDYGRTKVETEQWFLSQHAEVGFPATILRPTGVLGPGDIYVTLSIVRAIRQGKLKMLPGKADKLIHFTHVDDAVAGILWPWQIQVLPLEKPSSLLETSYLTYKEQFAMIANLCGVFPPTRSVPVWLPEMYVKVIEWNNRRKKIDDFFWHASLIDDMTVHRAYTNAKAKKLLGFHPQISLQAGLAQTIAWYQANNLLV